MNKITLGYWDVRGVAEPIRYLLHFKEIDFNEKRFKIVMDEPHFCKDWAEIKFTLGLDFPDLPFLLDGDVKITEGLTIIRYLAKKYNLYSENEDEILRMDLAEQRLLEYREQMFRIVYNRRDYEENRGYLLRKIPEFMSLLSKFIGKRKFVIGERITYVDFLFYELLDIYNLFSPNCLDENLKNYHQRIHNLPQLQKYFKSPSYHRLPIFGPLSAFAGNYEK